MKCQNCVKIQECNKDLNNICKEFKLYGTKPLKPKKSKSLCSGCYNTFYDDKYKDKGCYGYKLAKVVLESYPFHLNHVPPWHVRWQLSCFYRRW